ncbi:MAG: DNA-binding domain-containing protein [Methylococcales bacterium]
MCALRELQFEFARAVFDENSAESFGRRIRRKGLSGVRRMRIYRNNSTASLSEALGAVYPVTERLLGEDFFRQTAKSYVREVRSASGDIRRYGSAFPAFLSTLPGLKNYPYLRDIARLEWAYHSVFHGEIKAPLDLTALRAVAHEDYPALRFRLQPAARLMASDYPVLRIWQVNLEAWPGDRTVNLDEGGVHLLIQRREDSITVESLAAGDYRLLERLNHGERLADAIAAVVSVEPDFDPGGALGRFVSRGVLADFHNGASNEPQASFHQYPEV